MVLTYVSSDYLYNGSPLTQTGRSRVFLISTAMAKPDLIWQNQATGQLYYWLMNGVTMQSSDYLYNGQAR